MLPLHYVQDLFDLIRSYSFSLDWDDYVDPLSAVNCEDTFYEFNFNKVYTTAMFIDRYKNGYQNLKIPWSPLKRTLHWTLALSPTLSLL